MEDVASPTNLSQGCADRRTGKLGPVNKVCEHRHVGSILDSDCMLDVANTGPLAIGNEARDRTANPDQGLLQDLGKVVHVRGVDHKPGRIVGMPFDSEFDYRSKDKAFACSFGVVGAGVDAAGIQYAGLALTTILWDLLCTADQPYRRARLKVLLGIRKQKSEACSVVVVE